MKNPGTLLRIRRIYLLRWTNEQANTVSSDKKCAFLRWCRSVCFCIAILIKRAFREALPKKLVNSFAMLFLCSGTSLVGNITSLQAAIRHLLSWNRMAGFVSEFSGEYLVGLLTITIINNGSYYASSNRVAEISCCYSAVFG